MNAQAPGFVELNSPFSRPLHQLLLELVVLACTVLVFGHALREYRKGDRRHLFQWLVITAYGVQMELIAFNYLHNYEHALFSVQLYHGKLPLYVTGLYGSFMYAGVKIAERLEVHPIAEALLAGLAICLIDVPFDIAGVAVGWWKWLDTDPNLAYRWLGVPVTSYYWYLIFGAVAVLLCRVVWPRLARRSFALAAVVALVCGSGVIFFGVLGFLPFHAVHALGVSEGTIVATHIAGCAVLALVIRGRQARLSPMITAVVALLPGCHVLFLVWEGSHGRLPDAGLRIVSSAAALAGLVALSWFLPLRRTARASVPPSGKVSLSPR